jgi:hypothetical protein
MRKLTVWLQITALAAAVSVCASRTVMRAQLLEEEEDVRLPGGKKQKDEILKEDHRQNIADARRLVELSQALKDDLEKHDQRVFSLTALKNAEEIEKIAKRVRNRIRR